MTQVIAHRTCPLDAPENSLSGLRAAAAARADAVEIDVRRTRDGTPVLLHDPFLWRTARRLWPVAAVSREGFTASRHRGTDERLPTLADALAGLPAELWLAMEVKARGALVPALADVRAAGVARRTMVWVHDPELLRVVRSELPDVAGTALLRTSQPGADARRYLSDAADAGATAVSIHHLCATPAVLDAGRQLGLVVVCWVTDPKEHLRIAALGVDAIVTDWVTMARAAIERGSPGGLRPGD